MPNYKKKTSARVDEPQEQMRQTVIEQELSARSWKAYYEKMYYSMEAEKIEPAYDEYKARMAEKLEKFKTEQADMMKKLEEAMKESEGKVDGDITSVEEPVIENTNG